SWLGKLVLLGVVFSMWYHTVNGIRHLVWDTGVGLELGALRTSGLVVIGVSVVLTVVTVAVAVGGA
ncbi:MAG: succinate dehydrogenase, cytochrome b556 subunit, partial [Alphaproteobacteria bacterium]